MSPHCLTVVLLADLNPLRPGLLLLLLDRFLLEEGNVCVETGGFGLLQVFTLLPEFFHCDDGGTLNVILEIKKV